MNDKTIMKKQHWLQLFFIVCFTFGSVWNAEAKRVLKVLAIGNSFSVDAVEQNLYELAHAEGDSLVIGNAYIGGCSIDRHWQNAQTEKPEYSYRKIIGGKKTTKDSICLRDIIKDDDWDIITVQQSSPLSGMYESYTNLPNLLEYVRSEATNKHFRFAFHMTWAYAQNSKHSAFVNYNKDQMLMYNDIIKTVKQVAKHDKIRKVISVGTAVQDARTALGDSLCRDGYHLSLTVGRYVAACTWCEFLTGKNVVGNTYHPGTVSAEKAAIAQTAAHKAVKHPYKVIDIL